MAVRRTLLPPAPPPVKPDVSLFIVNIVLLLILFFLATGSLVNAPDQGVRLSETRDLPIDQVPSPVLALEDDGTVTLDGITVEKTELPRLLAEQTEVHILVNRDAPALDLLRLIDQPAFEALEVHLVTIHRRDGS